MPVARLIADCAITESPLTAGLSHLSPRPRARPAALPAHNPPGRRPLTALSQSALDCSQQKSNFISSPPLSIHLSASSLMPTLPSIWTFQAEESSSVQPLQDPGPELQGQFLWLPALPSSSHEEDCLVAQSGQRGSQRQRKVQGESLEAGGC